MSCRGHRCVWFVVGLATWMLVWFQGGRVALAQESEPLTLLLEEEKTRATQPGLVVLILDHSGSMGETRDVPVEYSGKTKWQASLEDAGKRIDSALRVEPGTVDVRVYTFDNQAAEYGGYRPFPRLTRGGGSGAAKAALDSLPRPSGNTRLHTSVRNIAQGLVHDDAMDAYAWIWIVLYSDGDDTEFGSGDSPRARSAEASMCSALKELSGNSRVFIDYLPIGNVTALDARCAGFRRTGFNQIRPPVLYRLTATPRPLRLTEAKAGGGLTTRIEWKGVPRPAEASIGLLGAPAGLSLVREGEDRLTWRFPADLSQGARFRMSVSLPVQNSGVRITTTNEVIVPPLARMPAVVDWGLPPPCPEEGGRRSLLVERANPFEISLNLPADARVKWRVSPGGGTQSGPVFRGPLDPGTHEVQVVASRPGSPEIAEVMSIHVVDPVIRIESVDGAKEAVAGDAFRLIARWHDAGLPQHLRRRFEATQAFWRVAGRRQDAKGSAIDAVFPESGPLGVDFGARLEGCGGVVQFRGSTIVNVKSGVSIRNLTHRMTKGYPRSIDVEVSDRELVDHVDVSIDQGRNWTATRYEGSDLRNVVARTPPFPKQAIGNAQSGNKLTVWERPIRKLPDGLVSDREDPENKKRQRVEEVELVPPEVELVVNSPAPDGEVPFGRVVPLVVTLSGPDEPLVKTIEVVLQSGSLTRRLGDMTKSEQRAGVSSWRSDVFKPDDRMGRDVSLTFEARDAEGQSLARVSIPLHPTAPKLALVADPGGVLRWGGGKANIPVVKVRLVESTTGEAYPDSLIHNLKWRFKGALEPVSPLGERDSTLSLRPVRRGQGELEVLVDGPYGRQTAALTIQVEPIPLRIENAPQPRLIQPVSKGIRICNGSDFLVRGNQYLDLALDGEEGAYESRKIELVCGNEIRRVDGLRGIPFPGLKPSWKIWRSTPPVLCAIRVIWVPWGGTDEITVERKVLFTAVAAPDVVQGFTVFGTMIILILGVVMVGTGNQLLGQQVAWEFVDPSGRRRKVPGSAISLLGSKATLNPFSKTVTIRLPNPHLMPSVGWLGQPPYRNDKIFFMKNKAAPSILSVDRNLRIQPVRGEYYRIVPSDIADSAPVYLRVSSGPQGQGIRGVLRLLALIIGVFLAGALVYLILCHPWPSDFPNPNHI
jgi:hypothetical protein